MKCVIFCCAAVSLAVAQVPPQAGWTSCAFEGGVCSFSGTMEVQYGANTSYVSKTLAGPVYCLNAVFGDPLPGVGKFCYYRAPQTGTAPVPSPAPTPPQSGQPGRVFLTKRAGPSFNSYTNSTASWVWDWMRTHYLRMGVYSPYFDSKTSQYSNGLIYVSLYGMCKGCSTEVSNPDWVMRDQSGNKLYIDWGCSGGTCADYAADFSHPGFRQWWVDRARQQLAGGNYKGLWIDNVNFDWRVSNGWGNFVNPKDRNTGQLMTLDNWRRYMAEFLEKIRADLGGYEILHNSIWYAGGDSGRDTNPYIQRQIEAANTINIEHGTNDGGLTGGSGPWSLTTLLSYIDRLTAKGKRVVIEGIAAGNSNDYAAIEYALANYFLVSNGTHAVGDFADVTTPDRLWSGFNMDLGWPQGVRYSWNGLLRRDFSAGMTLVNEPQAPWRTVNLGGSYRKADGQWVDSITLGPKQGAILGK